jgi:hypothetical protein
MATEAQIRANRENAKKSTGPKTEEGKARARFNARRHGLTGHILALASGDEAAYRRFERSHLTRFQPADDVERQLVGLLVQDYWRLGASGSDEQNMLSLRHDDFAEHTHADNEHFHAASVRARIAGTDGVPTLFALYESRITRNIEKREKRLAQLQAERKAREEQALAEAELLLKLARFKRQTLEPKALPQEIGSVFSSPRLRGALAHKLALAEARHYENNRWNRQKPWEWAGLNLPQPAEALPQAA